jgi:hypothetical protein
MTPMTTTMKLMLALAVIGLALQQLSILRNSFNDSVSNIAVAFVSNKPITQRLDYAHFLPLTNNNKLHQVKVIVDYTPISVGQYAYESIWTE